MDAFLFTPIRLFIRLWCQAQIWALSFVTFRILLLDDSFILYGQRNNDIVTIAPVTWSRNGITICQLQRIDQAQYFVEVTASTHWICNRQADFLLRIDYKQGTHGSSRRLIRMDHVVQSRNRFVGISDYRKSQRPFFVLLRYP